MEWKTNGGKAPNQSPQNEPVEEYWLRPKGEASDDE